MRLLVPRAALQPRHVGVVQLQERLSVGDAARLRGHGGGRGGAEGKGQGGRFSGAGGLGLAAQQARLQSGHSLVPVKRAVLVKTEPWIPSGEEEEEEFHWRTRRWRVWPARQSGVMVSHSVTYSRPW